MLEKGKRSLPAHYVDNEVCLIFICIVVVYGIKFTIHI